ncbi:MAG TPA: cell envelope biogenesis protein TolA [Sphingomonadaceae bacterium]|nr:cell envelope biogenesis protein TolA [Sphingomonadaceae bacterium]
MDRADGLGTGVAILGHVALFGALSLGLAASIPPKPAPPPAMEVEFVDTVALEAVAAPSTEAMAQAEAPEVGTPEEAMPQPAPAPEPLPLAPAPELVAAPPTPAPPRPKPPEPKPAEPRPVARAAPKPAPPKPAAPKPEPVRQAVAKPQKAAPTKQAAAKPAAAKSAPAKTAPAKAAGDGEKTAARAPRLGKNFLAGLSDPSPGKADKPQAPAISADAMAGIVAAIKRQVQPCANRQVNPGPGANRISVRLQLRLNPDGSLATAPRVVSTSGVDDENSRYEKRVTDLAIAAYTGCAPMRGLPEELYKTAKGGWSNINLNYKLPG